MLLSYTWLLYLNHEILNAAIVEKGLEDKAHSVFQQEFNCIACAFIYHTNDNRIWMVHEKPVPSDSYWYRCRLATGAASAAVYGATTRVIHVA